jgi:TolB-like protein/Flp pilus assembly protein TadD
VTEVFVSYPHAAKAQAEAITAELRALGYDVWRDDLLPPHRAYADVIEERLRAAKAVVVIWSTEAVKSQWVRAEAEVAREAGTLVQLTIDGAALPLPFNQIQCEDMRGWRGDTEAVGWRKVAASIADLVGAPSGEPAPSPSHSAALPLPDKPSIAVLPFANLSREPDQDYFADGMVEEITAQLARFKSLFVIASTSTLSLKGQPIEPQAAARRLGVRYLLEGSVRRAGERVRVAVKLIDAQDGVQLWSDRFDDTLEDVFALQDRVALSVAGVIAPQLQWAEVRHSAERPTRNITSYELYLRAIPLVTSAAKANVQEALSLLRRAVELDPGYAQAISVTAGCLAMLFTFNWSDDLEADRREGTALIRRALELAPDDCEVLANAAMSLLNLREDYAGAVRLIERSIALNPGSSRAWNTSGWLHSRIGEPDIAVEHFETALRLDPLSPYRGNQLTGMGIARLLQGRYQAALDVLEEAAQLRPGWPTNHVMMAACYGHLGRLRQASGALARLQGLITVPAEQWVRMLDLPEPIVAGIALAQGALTPPATPA